MKRILQGINVNISVTVNMMQVDLLSPKTVISQQFIDIKIAS